MYISLASSNNSNNTNEIIVYDYDENKYNIKVNESRLFIGIMYKINNVILIHAFISRKDYYYTSNTINTTTNTTTNNTADIRTSLLNYISSNITNSDILTAEYLILLMTSSVMSRSGGVITGSMCLNIIVNNNKENNSNKITDFLSSIFYNTILLENTVHNLNTNNLIPRFDNETETLITTKLQIPDNSLLILDETQLKDGKLNERGIKNLGFISKIIEFQISTYEYPYHPGVDIHNNIPIVILSEGKSILSSTCKSICEIRSEESISNSNSNSKESKDFSNTNSNSNSNSTFSNEFKEYLKYIRCLANKNNCRIEEDINKKMIEDFILERKNRAEKSCNSNNGNNSNNEFSNNNSYINSSITSPFTPEEFSFNINLAKLHALSHGREVIQYEVDYLYIKEMEKKRRSYFKKEV